MHFVNFFQENKDCPIFSGLDRDAVECILAHSTAASYNKGQILVQQGDTPKYLYFIMSGSLITFRASKEGAISAIRLLGKGETCMDAVIYMDTASPIGVQAVKNAEILQIDSAFVKQYSDENSVFANNLIRILAKYYRDALYQLDGLAIKPTTQRTGHYLLQNYLSTNSANFVMPFNRYLVASHLGMSFETLSRALSIIKDLGVEIKGSKVILSDPYALCTFCDEGTEAICKQKSDQCTSMRIRS